MIDAARPGGYEGREGTMITYFTNRSGMTASILFLGPSLYVLTVREGLGSILGQSEHGTWREAHTALTRYGETWTEYRRERK